MSVDWQGVADEVSGALSEVGFTANLKKVSNTGGSFYDPGQSETAHTITVMQDEQRVRDGAGTLTERTMRTLTIAADGPEIEKGDLVVIDGTDHRISEARAVAPGGVVLFYEADLDD